MSDGRRPTAGYLVSLSSSDSLSDAVAALSGPIHEQRTLLLHCRNSALACGGGGKVGAASYIFAFLVIASATGIWDSECAQTRFAEQ